MNTEPELGTVVVGVDGSEHSAKALAWAVDEARLRGMRLQAVHVFPAMLSLVGSTAHEYYPQVAKEAEQIFDRAIAQMPDTTGVQVERTLVAGNPAKVLIEASRDAEMLVVGSRGLGGFRGMAVGSVSMHCVHGAHCPVVVIKRAETV